MIKTNYGTPKIGIDERYHYVYEIINSINGKWYRGKHSTTKLKDNYSGSGTRITRSIKKHGDDNFIMNILYYCESEPLVYELEELLVTKEDVANPNCYNMVVGGCGSKERSRASKRIRAVTAYDSHGIKIKTYNSYFAAAMNYECCQDYIKLACTKGNTPNSKILWSFKNKAIKFRKIRRRGSRNRHNKLGADKIVDQYDLDHNLLISWASISMAAKALKLDPSSIAKVVNGTGDSYKVANCIWTKHNVKPIINKSKTHPRAKAVCQLNSDNKLIKIWKSSKHINDTLNIDRSEISRTCSGASKRNMLGYKWMYEDDYNKLKDKDNGTTE